MKAYASSFNNLGMPDDYAAHATDCQRQGYHAYKIHPYYAWDPATRQPTLPKPPPVDWDIEICRAVRGAVGDDMVLMFDPWGAYHGYADALRVGHETERLDFSWYEHPMPEYRVEQYVKLADELSIPICSPEIAEGGDLHRADWILRRASDVSRIDVLRGGITGAMKMAHLRGVRLALRTPRERHPATSRSSAPPAMTSASTTGGLSAPVPVWTTTPPRPTSQRPVTRWAATASSPCPEAPASATTSAGTSSTTTAYPREPTSRRSPPCSPLHR